MQQLFSGNHGITFLALTSSLFSLWNFEELPARSVAVDPAQTRSGFLNFFHYTLIQNSTSSSLMVRLSSSSDETCFFELLLFRLLDFGDIELIEEVGIQLKRKLPMNKQFDMSSAVLLSSPVMVEIT